MVARRAQIRASDADRDRVADRLRQAAAEGRLLTHELEHRLGVAFAARTYGELDELVFDLPSGKPDRRQGSSMAPWVKPAVALAIAIPLAVALLAAVLFVVTGIVATWMLWAAVAWWFFGHRHHPRNRFHGPRVGPPPSRRWI